MNFFEEVCPTLTSAREALQIPEHDVSMAVRSSQRAKERTLEIAQRFPFQAGHGAGRRRRFRGLWPRSAARGHRRGGGAVLRSSGGEARGSGSMRPNLPQSLLAFCFFPKAARKLRRAYRLKQTAELPTELQENMSVKAYWTRNTDS